MKRSQALRQLIMRTAADSSAVAAHFVEKSPLRRSYPEYLFMTHCLARASVPLLRAAAARARAISRKEPLAALRRYLEHHVDEERRHADWILEDLEVLGHKRAQVLARVPPPCVAAGVGAQYYWIEHYHPISLAGYMAVLEGCMAPPEVIERLIERSGLPRRAFRTLLVHSKVDREHSDDLDSILDRLVLTPEQFALVRLSAVETLGMLNRIFLEVVDRKRGEARVGLGTRPK